MATYDEWNKAIAEYFVSGLPSGATVYLSVDEEALMEIGVRFEQSGADYVNWVEDFTEAVRSKCVTGDKIHFPWSSSYQSNQPPRCTALLAAMILAAHYMIEEDTEDASIAQINYFTRLRQVLGLSDEETGRPEGLLPAGVEENLWQEWSRWLIGNGWLPSAERGQTNYDRYINYPLSQSLLREGDKVALEHLFRQRANSGQLSRVWDRDTVSSWVRTQQFGSRHLRELIQESDFRRYEAITDAVYDVYISIDWDQDIETEPGSRSLGQRRLTAELYRVKDFVTGNIDYYLYPRQLRQFAGGTLEVIRDGQAHPLSEDRKGWYQPLWPEDLAGGVSYEVRGHQQVKALVLSERDFWILVPDPEDETSGIFAGWRPPGLGETFLLLCREAYTYQMESFKERELLNWDHKFPIDEEEEWIEYRGCQIVSPNWDGVIPEHQGLYDALKPSVSSATISLKGGLRVPSQGGWLEGYVPEMTIMAFDDSVQLKLLDASSQDTPIRNQIVNTNEPVILPPFPPGDYLLQAYGSAGLAARRNLRIIPWDTLACVQPEQPFSVDVETFKLQGAIIEVSEVEGQEDA